MTQLLPDFFWIKIEDHWEIGATVAGEKGAIWWRWGSKWPLKPGAIREIGPKIERPARG
ncbi:hypothetical protein [Cognatiyoonia sp. IB215182]|uniref:hypothetical protein n=1 Tax=Cognatiyoonia sp. IB215182 TaxID=3097353 RepID=UPI002A10292F|nr:hypothetical protein [Cognatiyoonia sp. IB215182]MDX8354364.1 hypothetical protein [Cognatiyoonia sp. IB215182]